MRGYNAFGDLVEEQDPNGNVVTTVVDANGRPVSTTLPSYTPPGSSTAIVPVTVRTYDDAGRLQTHLVDLHRGVVAAEGELPFVLVVEARHGVGERLGPGAAGDDERSPLALVAHRGVAREHRVVG